MSGFALLAMTYYFAKFCFIFLSTSGRGAQRMWDDASVRNAFAARLAGRIGWRRRLDIFFLLAYNKNHTFTAFSL